jgi:hypothetical protein
MFFGDQGLSDLLVNGHIGQPLLIDSSEPFSCNVGSMSALLDPWAFIPYVNRIFVLGLPLGGTFYGRHSSYKDIM